jgi:hypothetical protein
LNYICVTEFAKLEVSLVSFALVNNRLDALVFACTGHV